MSNNPKPPSTRSLICEKVLSLLSIVEDWDKNEDIEALHLCLDDLGLPRETSDTLSLWGRVTFLRAELEALRNQEPVEYQLKDKMFDQRWENCPKHVYDKIQSNPSRYPSCEVRKLYASPLAMIICDSVTTSCIKISK